eukprot:395756_1
MSKGLHLVTGGTSGIGLAIATELVKKQYDVILGYNTNSTRANKSKQQLAAINPNCNIKLIKGDITEDATIDKYITTINESIATNNKLIGVTHVAGGWKPNLPVPGNIDFDSVEQMKNFEYFIKLYGTQLLQLFEKCKDIMIKNNDKQHNGSFVVIGASCNVTFRTPPSWYLAPGSGKTLSEFYCRMYARSFAKYKINVNYVIGGLIKTDAWDSTKDLQQMLKDLTKRTPMQRYALPQEVAYLVEFLLSRKASYITGTSVVIDGGKHLGELRDYTGELKEFTHSKL